MPRALGTAAHSGEEKEGLISGTYMNHSWTNRNLGEQIVTVAATPLGPSIPRPSQPRSNPLSCLSSGSQPSPTWSVIFSKHPIPCLSWQGCPWLTKFPRTDSEHRVCAPELCMRASSTAGAKTDRGAFCCVSRTTCQSTGTWEDLFFPSSFALRPCPLSSLKSSLSPNGELLRS